LSDDQHPARYEALVAGGAGRVEGGPWAADLRGVPDDLAGRLAAEAAERA